MILQDLVRVCLANACATENRPLYYEKVQEFVAIVKPEKNKESVRRIMQKMACDGVIQTKKGTGYYWM